MSALLLTLLVAQPIPPPEALEFIRGMSFAHVHAPGFGYGSDRAKKQLEKLKALGVDWVSITPFAYQPHVDQPELQFPGDGHAGDPTLTEGDLIKVIGEAHALGIKVLLKPHIWSNEFWRGGKWQGDIKMKNEVDADAWFQHYTAFIVHMAKLATRAHADALSIGGEYVAMTGPEHTSRWRQLAAAARISYAGPLTYCAHHDREPEQIQFWDSLDWIGVNAYFALGAELEKDDVTVEAIATEFLKQLKRFEAVADKKKKPVVLTEIGFPSHAGALSEPWKSDTDRSMNEPLQARAYDAALTAIDQAPWVRGVFFWKWFSGGRSNPFEKDPYQPEGKQAEKVLVRWFSTGSLLRPK
jgi:hypothetical protein